MGVYYCKSGDMIPAIYELMDVKYVSQSECRYTEYWSSVEMFFEKINRIFPELINFKLSNFLFVLFSVHEAVDGVFILQWELCIL